MESVIKWQTGEPKEVGRYLVSTKNGICCGFYHTDGRWGALLNGNVIAWCPLSDIEPYKE
jgi:hypothetical protein